MKGAIALCLLAVFCTANATILDILLRQVENTKRTVESTIQQLERIFNNVEQDVKLKVTKKWLQEIKEYNNHADPVLDTIRKEVEDAKARGKNAQPCYDTALNIFKSINYVASTDAWRCQESAENSIKNNLSFINHLITTGCELIEELNNILPDCYKNNSKLIEILKLRSCIRNQLGISKVNVKNLKTDANSAKSTAKSASNIVLQQATNCLNNVYSIAHSMVPEARSAATRCLDLV